MSMDEGMKKLRNPRHRRNAIEEMHESLMDFTLFPGDAISALELIIEDTINTGKKRQFAILRGSLETLSQNKKAEGIRVCEVFGKRIHLEGITEQTFVSVSIHGTTMTLSYDGRQKVVSPPSEHIGWNNMLGDYDDLFTTKMLTRFQRDNMLGVGFLNAKQRKRYDQSYIEMCKAEYNIPLHLYTDYVFVFFDHGNLYILNSRGEFISCHGSKNQTAQELKTKDIYSSFDDYNTNHHSETARRFMVEGFMNASKISKFTNYLLVRGHCLFTSTDEGLVRYAYFGSGLSKKLRSSCIGKAYANITGHCRGPYLVFIDEDGNRKNNTQLQSPGLCVSLPYSPLAEAEEIIALKHIEQLHSTRIKINGTCYSFKNAELSSAAEPATEMAILAHIGANGGTNRYFLLQKKGDDVTQHELFDVRVAGPS